MADPTVTLLTLAERDEPLRGMLAHHRTLVDEIVVVDTGAGEATAVAVAAGARAVSHPWDEDFAVARNVGLAAAGSDWILILDTDELIAPADFAALRTALNDPPAVRLMTTINYYGDARHPEWRPLAGRYPHQEQGQTGCFVAERGGLFPRRRGLTFEGRVHETILPAARRLGLPLVSLPTVPVHHYGFVLSGAYNQQRQERYGRLVRAKFADQPDDPGTRLELATVLLEEGQIDDAHEHLAFVVDARPIDSAVTRARFLLGRLLREKGETAAARDVLAQAVADDPRLIFCWLELLRTLAVDTAWAESDRVLRAARERFGDDPLLDKEELRLLLKTGRIRAAAAVVARLQQDYPQWQDLQGLAARLTGRS